MKVEIKMNSKQHGFVLISAVSVLALASLLILTYTHQSGSNSSSFSSIFRKNKAFLLVEGARYVVQSQAQKYLSSTATPTPEEMNTYLNNTTPSLMPSGYSLSQLKVSQLASNQLLPVMNGPYAGILTPTTSYQIDIGVQSTDKSAVAHNQFALTFASVSLFQFLLFVDLNYADFNPGMAQKLNGPVYVNGDFCIASTASILQFSQVSASGRLMTSDDSRCLYPSPPNAGVAQIAVDSNFSNFTTLSPSSDNSCIDCAGTGYNWNIYNTKTWNGNVQDEANGIKPLKLNITSGAIAQFGVNGTNFTPTSNESTLRFLVDPIVPTDTDSVAKGKFAYKADIRIIDGVWYLKDPSNLSSWPGIPIWSDHPGGADSNTTPVGQDDIRALWASKPSAWALGQTPHLYSFYGYDRINKMLDIDKYLPASVPYGAISYGGLYNRINVDCPLAGNPRSAVGINNPWAPGGWIDPTLSAAPICLNESVTCEGSMTQEGFYDAINTATTCVSSPRPPVYPDSNVTLTCGGGISAPTLSTNVLNATRAGFSNRNISKSSPSPNQLARAAILPINVDLLAFQNALASTAPGELGTYFGTGKFMGRAFNGVIYISATWPGSLDGFGTGAPKPYPFQGSALDPLQTAYFDPNPNLALQTALPYPLCSNPSSASHPGLAGKPYDQLTNNRFTIPDCSSYTGTSPTILSFPNAVRVMNGANLDPTLLTNGLSLVSNLPVYIMGDFNANSDTSSAAATPYLPALVAGDQISILSNWWHDGYDHWGTPINPLFGGDQSQRPFFSSYTMTHNMALLAGFSRGSVPIGDAGLNDLPSYLETWGNGTTYTFSGSIVVGFYPVYQISLPTPGYDPTFTFQTVYYPPSDRNFSFDRHFTLPKYQPPGAANFFISAMSAWLAY